ncbi:hypothetical protein ABH966_004237 [Lysinibacillus sp. RC46]|uniref:hypothetical protein n=1 Tax=Lysinibacillus sp. RC46 TaxID=3156295 RepID=UPI003510D316
MKKVIQSFLCSLFVLALFFINNSIVHGAEKNIEEAENGVLPFEQKVKGTEIIDGKRVTVYEDLPDKIITYENPITKEKTVLVDNEISSLSVDNEISPLCASCDYTVQTKNYQWIEKQDYNFGWHPDFSSYKRASGYYFSVTKSVSFGVSVGYGFVSVSAAQSASAGYFIEADYSKWSRPAVFGVYMVTNYKEEKYNAAGKLLSTTYKNYPSAQKTYEKVLYQ